MIELDTIIESAMRFNATDLHIIENDTPKIRVNGRIKDVHTTTQIPTQLLVEQIFTRLPALSAQKARTSFTKGKDIDCAISTPNGSRARANIYQTNSGLQIAIRLLPSKILQISDIGLPFAITDICKRKSGLFIVTGANASGKTTTLASIIETINTSQQTHILTIENPIEYLFKSRLSLITQREIGTHAESFYSALRSSVRENPDVIMLGEMRDIETTRTAIELAETGRLVFATLHTRTASSAIDRLIGQFPAGEQNQVRIMLSENLIGVLSQTLLEKKGGGLIAGFELLLNTDAIRNMIREQKTPQIQSAIQMGKNVGMISMEQSILQLLERGLITKEEALAKAYRPQDMAQLLQSSGL